MFVSGPGTGQSAGDLGFTVADANRIYALVQEAVNWVGSNSRSPVNFTFDMKIATITTPNGSPANPATMEESYWRIPAMTALGFSPPTPLTYTQQLVSNLSANPSAPSPTDLAFCILVSRYASRALGITYDSSSGLYCTATYYNLVDSETSASDVLHIKNIVAHETGHIFGAADEYASSNCTGTRQFGVLSTINGNCANAPGGGQPCVMNYHLLQACMYTRWQWGCPSFQTLTGARGIGGWDLFSTQDLGFAFDYQGLGKRNHLVFYRPGTGAIFIIKNSINDGNGATFTRVYGEGDPGVGIGGWDLADTSDRCFAFDYDSAGAPRFLFFYRARAQLWGVLQKKVNNSTRVTNYFPVGLNANAPNMSHFNGTIGGLAWTSGDTAFAFDKASTGKLDHVVIYQGGIGKVYIFKTEATRNVDIRSFVPVYQTSATLKGIGGYDLSSVNDRITPFDYSGSGKADHLVIYRPGTGIIWIVKEFRTATTSTYSPVFQTGTPTLNASTNGAGIAGYDLMDTRDRCFAFDYNGVGKQDHLVFYRPGTGKVSIITMTSTRGMTAVYAQNTGGIAGFDFANEADKAFAFDYTMNGKQNSLVMYRPGGETATIVPSGPGFRATI